MPDQPEDLIKLPKANDLMNGYWFVASALIGAAVLLTTEIRMIRRMKRLNDSVDNLHGMILFNMQQEFQEQVDYVFNEMIEEGTLEDPEA